MGVRFRKPPFKRFEIGRAALPGGTIHLAKPLTFMNCSGEVLKPLLRYTGCDLADVVVVCDTLDLPIGACRLKKQGTSAGQKGLASIIASAGTQEIRRLFIGVGRPEFRGQVVNYVLEKPAGAEADAFAAAATRAADGILRLVSDPLNEVMSELNRAGDPPAS